MGLLLFDYLKKRRNTDGEKEGILTILDTIKRHYKNWKEIITSLAIQRYPKRFVLRDGTELEGINDFQFFHLARLLDRGWEIDRRKNDQILLRKGNLMKGRVVMWCRFNRGFDIGHLLEIFERRRYKGDFKGKTVVDAGGSNGDSSIYFAEHGAKKVICLEPDKEAYRMALENVTENGLENWITVMNVALVVALVETSNWKTYLQTSSENPNANSTNPSPFLKQMIHYDNVVSVDGITLERLMVAIYPNTIDYLKMDTEGEEENILKHTETKTLKKIGTIRTEYHNGANDLVKSLQRKGFKVEVESEESKKIGFLTAYALETPQELRK